MAGWKILYKCQWSMEASKIVVPFASSTLRLAGCSIPEATRAEQLWDLAVQVGVLSQQRVIFVALPSGERRERQKEHLGHPYSQEIFPNVESVGARNGVSQSNSLIDWWWIDIWFVRLIDRLCGLPKFKTPSSCLCKSRVFQWRPNALVWGNFFHSWHIPCCC